MFKLYDMYQLIPLNEFQPFCFCIIVKFNLYNLYQLIYLTISLKSIKQANLYILLYVYNTDLVFVSLVSLNCIISTKIYSFI